MVPVVYWFARTPVEGKERVQIPSGTQKLIQIMKKIILIFIISFVLNLIWENLHSLLYDNYMGGEITQFILLRATLVDALITIVIVFPFALFPLFKKYSFLLIPTLVVVAVGNEYYALQAGAWAYNSLMPMIPIIDVGLTPAIQLGLLGYVSYKAEERISSGGPLSG